MELAFTARLWEYSGQGAWHFVTLPRSASLALRQHTEGRRNVGGTAKVTARIGRSQWRTSVFWDTKRAAFLLPVKAAVRAKEQLAAGLPVDVLLLAD